MAWVGKIILGGLVTAALALGVGWFQFERFQQQPLNLTTGRVLELKRGSNLQTLAADLEQRGELSTRWALLVLARLKFSGKAIKAGAYELQPGLTPAALLDKLTRGEVIQYRISFIEGWTFRQWRKALEQDPRLDHRLNALSDAQLMQQLGRPDLPPEGRFFPDTYLFGYRATDISVLQQALASMDQKLAFHWAQRADGLPLENSSQALILASIIEKESGVQAELAQISGVFIRRLQRGIKLQTDPTVIYGLGSGFDGNLRKADLLRPSPYNTYLNLGLPPTPIAMPGEAALKAAMNPDRSNTLFFVADGKGGHVFSETLDQHNAAVRRYLQQLKEQR